jgi:hypothetical protein
MEFQKPKGRRTRNDLKGRALEVCGAQKEKRMYLKPIIVTSALLLATSAFAQSPTQNPQNSTPNNTPGHQMQEKGSVPGSPGASGYAPGHVKKEDNASHRDNTGSASSRSDTDRDHRRTSGSGSTTRTR